jgi:translocation and assembly module TamB
LEQSGGDPAAALTNLAGGTVLNFLQDFIGETLNLTELNIRPVITTPEGARSSVFGLSAEAAIDLSNSFSAAVQRIINDPTQPTNFSLRYRITPGLQLRTNYSSNGNTGITAEFETRF